MQAEKRQISLFWYHILHASLTNLTFLAIGCLIAFLYKLNDTLIIIVIIILLVKSGVIGFVTWSLNKRAIITKDFSVNFIGSYFGRFYGMVAGGLIGAVIAKGIGAIAGAFGFYFIGRWAGARLGINLGQQLDKVFSIRDKQDSPMVRDTNLKRYFPAFYIVFTPLIFIILALLLDYYDILFTEPVSWLPIARAVAILLSLFVFLYPWAMRKQWATKKAVNKNLSGFDFNWIGLGLSAIPVVYGFALFFLGASLLEMCCFAIASSASAAIWWSHIKNKPDKIKEKLPESDS
jgi:hypothetical protein